MFLFFVIKPQVTVFMQISKKIAKNVPNLIHVCYQKVRYFENSDSRVCFLTSSWQELLFYLSKKYLMIFVHHKGGLKLFE